MREKARDKLVIGNAVEELVQRARFEVIDACNEHYDELPREVQERMKIFIWLDDQSYPQVSDK